MANDNRGQQRQASPQPAPLTVASGQGAAPQSGMPADLPTRKGWEEQIHEHLWAKGWRPTGEDRDNRVLWSDPLGVGGPAERKLSHHTKDEGGNQVAVYQMYAKPIPWSHPTMEAYGIQTAREQWEADAPKRAARAQADADRKRRYQEMLEAKRAQRRGQLAGAKAGA